MWWVVLGFVRISLWCRGRGGSDLRGDIENLRYWVSIAMMYDKSEGLSGFI